MKRKEKIWMLKIILKKTLKRFVIPKKACFGDRFGKTVFDESDGEEGSQEIFGSDEEKFGDERLDEEGNNEMKDNIKEKEEGNKPNDM